MGGHFGNSQTTPLCWRLRRWHGASFPSSVGIPVLLGLLGFSDWQLVQVLVESCHLFSSQAAHRHLQLVPVREKMLCPFQWAPSDSRDYVSGTIASFSWYLDLFLRFSATLAFSGFMGLLIELQVDGASRECEGFIIVILTEAIFFW